MWKSICHFCPLLFIHLSFVNYTLFSFYSIPFSSIWVGSGVKLGTWAKLYSGQWDEMGFLGKELSLIPSASTVKNFRACICKKNTESQRRKHLTYEVITMKVKKSLSKTPMKEIKQEPNKWRDIPWSWVRRLKMLVLSNFIYRFNVIPIKITASYFVDISNPILMLTGKGDR